MVILLLDKLNFRTRAIIRDGEVVTCDRNIDHWKKTGSRNRSNTHTCHKVFKAINSLGVKIVYSTSDAGTIECAFKIVKNFLNKKKKKKP